MTEQPASRRAQRTWLWWTGGKDSAWALHMLQQDPLWRVSGLVGAVNRGNKRSAAHGLKQELLEEQAAAVDLPLRLIDFDWRRPSSEFDASVQRVFTDFRRSGVEALAYGDLSSSCARIRSSVHLAGTGLTALFPLWGLDSRKHAETILNNGLSAWVCSSYTHVLPADYVGRRFDAEFLADLPASVDPCGETGEFHTFVEWAPGWNRRVAVSPRRAVDTYIFAFAELGRCANKEPPGPPRQEPVSTDKRLEEKAQSQAPDYDPFKYFKRLGRVRKHVLQHLQDDLAMEGLQEELAIENVARVAAMSAPAFGRYFRQHVGIRFGTWLAKQRIDAACRLLRKSNASVKEIGLAAGFGSQRTFRRAFREHVGISPSNYKRHYLLGEGGADGSACA